MTKTSETESVLPVSMALSDPRVSAALQDVFSHQILQLIYRETEARRSHERDASVTLDEIESDFPGIAYFQLQLRIGQMSQGRDALVQFKEEGTTWRVRLTTVGIDAVEKILQRSQERYERFRETVASRFDQMMKRLPDIKFKDADALIGGVKAEIKRSVRDDIGGALAYLRRLNDIVGDKRVTRKRVYEYTVLQCVRDFVDDRNRRASSAKTSPGHRDQINSEIEVIRSYITDVAQVEVVEHLAREQFSSVLEEIRVGSTKHSPRHLCIVLDLNVIIAYLCDTDRLSIPVKECIAFAEEAGMKNRDSELGHFVIPKVFYFHLQELLDRTARDFRRLRAIWEKRYVSDLPPKGEVFDLVKRLAERSLFREFVFHWRGDDFTSFARKIMGSFRMLTWNWSTVECDSLFSTKTYNQYLCDLVSEMNDRDHHQDVRLWTFDEALSRKSFSLSGGVLPTLLDPGRLTHIKKAQQELTALEAVSWWREGLLGADNQIYRSDISENYLEAINRACSNWN